MFQFLHPFAEGQDRTSWHRWTKGKVINFEMFFLKKNGPTPASFLFIFVFSNKHYKFHNKYECEKMSIQYPVLGFELTTF